MIKCISIASANDASVAMAEFISGSEEAFVSQMNEKAAALGMKDTTFINCCGLDTDNHLNKCPRHCTDVKGINDPSSSDP